MARQELKKSQKRAIRRGLLYHYMTVASVTACALVLAVLVWYFMAPGHSRVHHVESAETVSITGAVKATEAAKKSDSASSKSDPTVDLYPPTKEDGTGEAGLMSVTDGRTGSSGLSGWQESEGGRWYEVARNICYYGGFKEINGSTYYFDKKGYAAIGGWKAIAYRVGAYFDGNGVYVPNKDKSRMICLTFEKGPTEYTSDVLDILSEYGAKATFFLQGSNIDAHSELVSRISALGHTVGNFTYNGVDVSYQDDDTILRAFGDTDELIAAYSDLPRAEVVRFPDGYYTREQVALVDHANILWDVETNDLETDDPVEIVTSILSQLQGGIVVRMHDDSQSTVEALKLLLSDLVSRGYEFVNIKDMAASRGYELEDGVSYLGFKQSDWDAYMVNDK